MPEVLITTPHHQRRSYLAMPKGESPRPGGIVLHDIFGLIPGTGQQAATGDISGRHLGGIIIAGITVPIYDGGIRAATLAQSEASADSANAALVQARDELTRQVVDAEDALQTSLAAYSASQALVATAQTTYDAALSAYQNGVGSVTDTTLAKTQLLQAQNTESDSYGTALLAAATLAFTTGTLGTRHNEWDFLYTKQVPDPALPHKCGKTQTLRAVRRQPLPRQHFLPASSQISPGN